MCRENEAIKISTTLVEQKLAVCIKRSNINSIYHWDGKIKHASEVLLMIESVEEKFDKIVETLNTTHSDPYYVLTMIPVSKTTRGVLEWIEKKIR